MNSKGKADRGALLCLLLAFCIAPAARAGDDTAAAKARILNLPLPAGSCHVRIPADFTSTRHLPILVFLPSGDRPSGSWMDIWGDLADRNGFIVAIPAPCKPDPVAGYPELAVISTTRAAVSAGGDPDRVAIVAHQAAGRGLCSMLFTYPGLARTAIMVEALPATIKADRDLATVMPAMTFLTSNRRIKNAVDGFRRQNPGLRVQVEASLKTDGPFTTELASAALARALAEVPPGARDRTPAAPPEPDRARCANLLAAAHELRRRGAGAGAYVMMLRAIRCDPRSTTARLSIAQLCLESLRFAEAADWAQAVLADDPDNSAAALCCARALIHVGLARQALDVLDRHGASDQPLRIRLAARLTALDGATPAKAGDSYFRAVRLLREGEFAAAAAEARKAVASAPCDAACRVLLVYAIGAAEGAAAARNALTDYLDIFPDDPRILPLSRALERPLPSPSPSPSETVPPRITLDLPKPPPAGAAAGLVSALITRGGWALPRADGIEKLAGRCANGLRGALPFLAAERIDFAVGSGDLADLRIKLASDLPVLIQMPPGELAGLREGETFVTGVPRMVVGYDDTTGCILLQDYGSARPLPVPTGLFEMLWSRTGHWWMVIPAPGKQVPGRPGSLTRLESAVAMSEAGDFRPAADAFRELLADHPGPALLGLGVCQLKMGLFSDAARNLQKLADEHPELSAQAELALGAAVMYSPETPEAQRKSASLTHLRRAWEGDPAGEGATLALATALAGAGSGAEAEALQYLDDFLQCRPDSLPALGLYYSIRRPGAQ
jgi:tetratricopeptide (TPR) repeat protein